MPERKLLWQTVGGHSFSNFLLDASYCYNCLIKSFFNVFILYLHLLDRVDPQCVMQKKPFCLFVSFFFNIIIIIIILILSCISINIMREQPTPGTNWNRLLSRLSNIRMITPCSCLGERENVSIQVKWWRGSGRSLYSSNLQYLFFIIIVDKCKRMTESAVVKCEEQVEPLSCLAG